jgi:hypothetical protein
MILLERVGMIRSVGYLVKEDRDKELMRYLHAISVSETSLSNWDRQTVTGQDHRSTAFLDYVD